VFPSPAPSLAAAHFPADAAAKRRVLLVSRDLDPVGTGRQIALIAAGLASAGYEVAHAQVTAAGPQRGEPARTPAAEGWSPDSGTSSSPPVSTHRLATRRVLEPAALARLAAFSARLRPAVVVTFGRGLVPVAALVRAAVPRVRAIAAVGVPGCRRGTVLVRRSLDLVVASSPEVAAGWRGTPTVVIPPGIEPAPIPGASRAEVARRLGLDPLTRWTLCVAPLEPRARLDRLLWAIDQLGVVHRGLEHVLIGAGPLAARVRRRARVQELAERLVVVPTCDVLPDLLAQVRLVWQSGSVACGGAVLDGMARGVPAVMVDSEAARQLVVDGETGRVVPAMPESELPRRTLAILEDDALAARYGAAAAARAAAEFPAAALVARWREVIAGLIG